MSDGDNYTKPSKEDVTIGRLNKKIRKLQQQRNYWKEVAEKLETIIKLYPYIQSEIGRYENYKEKMRRLAELEKAYPIMLNTLDGLIKEKVK